MKRYKSYLIAFGYCIFSQQVLAQKVDLSTVISKVLSNNLDIGIANVNVEINQNRNNIGSAGYLPNINLNAAGNFSQNNTSLEFAGNLPPVEVKNAQNTGLSAGIGLNYLIFNGFGRVYTYQNLIKSQQISEVQARLISENTIMNAVAVFANIQALTLSLPIAKENIAISNDFVRRSENRQKYGQNSSLDVLRAKSSLNADSLSYLNLLNNLEKAKESLAILMGISNPASIVVSSDFPIPQDINLADLQNISMQNNTNIELAKLAIAYSEMGANITGAQRMPVVSLNANYGISDNKNGAGIILSQQNLGFSSGVTLAFPIFNGNQINIAIANAKLNTKSQEINLEKATLELNKEVRNLQRDIAFIQQEIAIQTQNITLAQQALKRSTEAYNLGQISYTDVRLAQLAELSAKNQLVEKNIQLILLYYSASRLAGNLINK